MFPGVRLDTFAIRSQSARGHAASFWTQVEVRSAAALRAVQQNGLELHLNIIDVIGDDWYRQIQAKGQPVIRIIEHLRDTRASLRTGAKVAGLRRTQLKSVINDGWYDMEVDELNRIADAICTIAPRRPSFVSERLESWRKPL